MGIPPLAVCPLGAPALTPSGAPWVCAEGRGALHRFGAPKGVEGEGAYRPNGPFALEPALTPAGALKRVGTEAMDEGSASTGRQGRRSHRVLARSGAKSKRGLRWSPTPPP